VGILNVAPSVLARKHLSYMLCVTAQELAMANTKLRAHQTDTDNLVSNLRGEVGDIVTTWVLYRSVRAQAVRQSSGDIQKDLENQSLGALHMICDKLRDAAVAQLSELGQEKIGRLNFHFASCKLKAFEQEAKKFSRYVDKARLTEKRNYDISHRELPEKWSGHKSVSIPERHLVRAIAMALRLIKQMDTARIGPAAPYLWREMRKKRYELLFPGRVAYMLLPHINLEPDAVEQIIKEEEKAGKDVWTEMSTLVNGVPATVRVAKQWGVVDVSSIKPANKKPKEDFAGEA
jgi:hypothetical protein